MADNTVEGNPPPRRPGGPGTAQQPLPAPPPAPRGLRGQPQRRWCSGREGPAMVTCGRVGAQQQQLLSRWVGGGGISPWQVHLGDQRFSCAVMTLDLPSGQSRVVNTSDWGMHEVESDPTCCDRASSWSRPRAAWPCAVASCASTSSARFCSSCTCAWQRVTTAQRLQRGEQKDMATSYSAMRIKDSRTRPDETYQHKRNLGLPGGSGFGARGVAHGVQRLLQRRHVLAQRGIAVTRCPRNVGARGLPENKRRLCAGGW